MVVDILAQTEVETLDVPILEPKIASIKKILKPFALLVPVGGVQRQRRRMLTEASQAREDRGALKRHTNGTTLAGPGH
jgi:hypothetical protein